jgi:hypothetical protein
MTERDDGGDDNLRVGKTGFCKKNQLNIFIFRDSNVPLSSSSIFISLYFFIEVVSSISYLIRLRRRESGIVIVFKTRTLTHSTLAHSWPNASANALMLND